MDNLFTYIKWRGDLELSVLPLTIEDQLILANLSYTRFEAFAKRDEEITLKEALDRILDSQYSAMHFRVRNDYNMVKALSSAKRFSSLLLSDAEAHFDKGKKQFFALTLHLPNGDLLISYRGTDNTVTGWKEDFDMAYEAEVPAQKEALEYLKKIAKKYKGKIIVTGHSKGGNLAIYASAMAPKRVQARIKRVFNNDGPGLSETNKAFNKIREIEDKITTIVPECSMIGMLMNHSENYKIVASSNRFIMQHDPYSWIFDGPSFKYLEERSSDSLLFESVVSTWLNHASHEEREIFVDAAYKCISSIGIDNFTEKSLELFSKTPGLIRSFKNLTEEEKRVMRYMLRTLVKATRSNIISSSSALRSS